MLGLSTGLSALRVSQRALDIVGENVANANTPGYHRQVANLTTRLPVELDNLSIGTGVRISDVRRLRSGVLESALMQHQSQLNDTATQLESLRRIESFLASGEGSIHDMLEKFFNGLEQLSTRPSDLTMRRVVLGTAAALSDEFNYVSGEFDRLQSNLDLQISSFVDEINSLTQQIAELNPSIQRSVIRGINPNDLMDQRDQLIQKLAELTAIRTVDADHGQTSVFLEGMPLVLANTASKLRTSTDSAGNTIITNTVSNEALALSGGKLGASLQLRNNTVPGYRDDLDTLAHEFIRAINGTHSTGLGLTGQFNFLTGDQSVSSATVPLSQAGLAFPPQSGSLFVTVTDLATGQRTVSEVTVDPSTQSLNDVANAIDAIPGVGAVIDGQTQILSVLAESGFAFEFTGRLETHPNAAGISGTSRPQIDGTYTGSDNDTFTFQVVGTGTVGVTPGLILEVRNSANSVIASLNIGQGYEPGSFINVADGVRVQLSAGTVNNGDNFSIRVIAQPDTAEILTALGLAGLFSGSTANNIRVREDVLLQPERLAGSRSGLPGDGANLARMASLRDQLLLANGTRTLRDGYSFLVSDVGSNIQNLTERQSHQELLGLRLETERQSVSGVDSNEELVRMIQFQKAFQLAARYINVVNETLDELVRLV